MVPLPLLAALLAGSLAGSMTGSMTGSMAGSLAEFLIFPVTPVRVLEGFRAPADTYAPGHRGMDLVATPGQRVSAPISGIVRFRGRIAGKDVVVISDGRRVVSLEPVRSALAAGDEVHRGAALGTVGSGGHCDSRCVHVGLRVDDVYLPPFAMHARLLP